METKPLEEEIIAEGELEVYGGKHTVPSGVGVEELDGGKQKLSKECPAPVKEILDRHDLVATHDSIVASIVESLAQEVSSEGGRTKSSKASFRGTRMSSPKRESRSPCASTRLPREITDG